MSLAEKKEEINLIGAAKANAIFCASIDLEARARDLQYCAHNLCLAVAYQDSREAQNFGVFLRKHIDEMKKSFAAMSEVLK